MTNQRPTYEESVIIPEKVTIHLAKGVVTVKGPKGEIRRMVTNPKISFVVNNQKLIATAPHATQREVTHIRTNLAHLKNMCKGVLHGHVYKLRICSGHFPMNVSVQKGQFMVKNLFGEKIPRTLKISEGVTVKVEGTEVIVEGVNKEVASQTAASIEQLTRRTGFDRRIFQDGIYIYHKDGKEIQ
ncbi:50S ribosomal protein L6 [Candidatus Woesearchaeota archaeon]|nr:50S ribosomal protein L6 [Candidatus Woesearchaeota archaeon]